MFFFKWVLITAAFIFLGLNSSEAIIGGFIVAIIDSLFEEKKEIVVIKQ